MSCAPYFPVAVILSFAGGAVVAALLIKYCPKACFIVGRRERSVDDYAMAEIAANRHPYLTRRVDHHSSDLEAADYSPTVSVVPESTRFNRFNDSQTPAEPDRQCELHQMYPDPAAGNRRTVPPHIPPYPSFEGFDHRPYGSKSQQSINAVPPPIKSPARSIFGQNESSTDGAIGSTLLPYTPVRQENKVYMDCMSIGRQKIPYTPSMYPPSTQAGPTSLPSLPGSKAIPPNLAQDYSVATVGQATVDEEH